MPAEEQVVDQETPREESQESDIDISVLDLPDEEFMKQGGETAFQLNIKDIGKPPAKDEEEPDTKDNQSSEESEDSEDSVTDSLESDNADEEYDDEAEDTELGETDDQETDESDSESEEDEEEEEEEPDTEDVDYKAEYQRILSPFKANGKDIQVDSIDDAIRLMQMGAGFNRKMQILKPRLKIIKMLENHDLLDEAKINNLIDLSKKDPKAITKLLKDSGLDPLDINADEEVDYQPKDYRISEREFNLTQAIEAVKDSETFDKTMNVLGKQWDEQSRNMIVDSPEFIGILNTHMQNGVYDRIAGIMEQQKALGKLTGVPDVQAYHTIAENLFKQGVLIDATQQNGQQGAKTPGNESPEPVVKKTAPKKGASKSKRRAAASSRATRTSPREQPSINVLDMPDDEFLKRYS